MKETIWKWNDRFSYAFNSKEKTIPKQNMK